MRKLILTGAALLLAAPVFSQNQAFPPAYDTKDGGASSTRLGQYANGHHQVVYGDLYGLTQVYSWKGIQWRRSTTNLAANVGRSWSNFKLQLGQWNMVVTDEWSLNLGKSPTTVYSGSFSLPDTPGTAPAATPATWGMGTKANDMQLIFTQSYLFLSSEGLCVDYSYSGGTLGSNAAWTTNSVIYRLDGIANGNMTNQVGASVTATSGCTAGYFVNWLFTDRMPAAKKGDLFRTQLYEYGPAGEANKLHVGVINTAVLTTPTPFVSSCHKLYLDLSKGFVIFPYITDSAGDYFSPFYVSPYIAAAVGLDVWTQAAYDDNSTPPVLQLTRAGKAPIATVPTANPFTVTQYLWRNVTSSKLGYGPYVTDLPVVKMIQ